MVIWMCSSSAAEEGQRALANPHSLVQFLGSYIDNTAEKSLLYHDSTMAWKKTSGWLPLYTDHAQKQICNSTQRKTISYSHHRICAASKNWRVVFWMKTEKTTCVSEVKIKWCNANVSLNTGPEDTQSVHWDSNAVCTYLDVLMSDQPGPRKTVGRLRLGQPQMSLIVSLSLAGSWVTLCEQVIPVNISVSRAPSQAPNSAVLGVKPAFC